MDGNGLQIAGVFLTFFNHIQVGSAFRAVIYHVNIDLRENNFLVKKIAHTVFENQQKMSHLKNVKNDTFLSDFQTL